MALESAYAKEVIIQISPFNSRELKFLDLAALMEAFRNDPDLVNIDTGILPQVFQTLFVATGCDYTVKLEKLLFCDIFFNMLTL